MEQISSVEQGLADALVAGYADGARWYDQKVLPGNLAIIAQAVDLLDINQSDDGWFTRFQVQKSNSLNFVLEREYGKPSLDNENAANEYDKLISQNLSVLACAGVLESQSGKCRRYRVRNKPVLVKLSGNESVCRVFLIKYIRWSLENFNWWQNIENYINGQHTNDDMQTLKRAFCALMVEQGLGSRGAKDPCVEASRIFSKVINLIAYQYMVPGVERGKVMKQPPSSYDLTYNRPNFRDYRTGKPKNKTRKEYYQILENQAVGQRQTILNSAKKKVRDYHAGISEVGDTTGIKASHIHHIFPASQFPALKDTLENLIALTPGQHLGEAHPNGNTTIVDPMFQRICLARKLESIKTSVDIGDGMYSYENFSQVLKEGWGLEVKNATYEKLQEMIIAYVV
ncbi:hypothetical protein SAMN04489737_0256 [Arcanobacterium phocae]|uniref:Uncharacterized protein n=1 Tax=Arcanobacterium phocae TaxID=131112 RepID=A0A1H2LC11_9ACTO|nr:hypothetical protein [Arcanobacterium phocae]SDU77956.1 hypothetical protein SAMN04489737_0256 [Arcanobacterium phocae]